MTQDTQDSLLVRLVEAIEDIAISLRKQSGREHVSARARTQPASASRLVPCKRAASEIGIPYTTLRLCAQKGQIPLVMIGRAWYFERSEVDAFIKRRAQN